MTEGRPAVEIVRAGTDAEYEAARELILTYQRWLGLDLGFQGFSEELLTLETVYGPPGGAMMLARADGTWIGCAGLRRLEDSFAEMKRMFVLPAHQGKGAGRALTLAVIETARGTGYAAIRLDTIPRLDRAIHLYESLGFRRIAPYRHNPDTEAIFMELKLAARSPA